MEITRQYKYLIKPDKKQKEIIIRTFGAVRYVHNRFVEDARNKEFMRGRALSYVEKYRKESPFLRAVDGSALMNQIFQLQDNLGKPMRFKKRNDSYVSYSTGNLVKNPIRILGNNKIQLPHLGIVEMVYHRPIPEDAQIKKAAIIRNREGKYYVGITITYKVPDHNDKDLDFENSVGIDYSSPHFFVDDKGRMVDMPHFYLKEQGKLAKEIKKLQSMVKGSNNYYEQKRKIAALYGRIRDQRADYLHKLSSEMADKYDVICVEDLDMQGIAQGYSLGKRTYDNGYGTFIGMLEYKMKERGKLLLKADRYYPSSKTCHICGYIKKDLRLEDRTWICPQCGSVLDRDRNAAINIKKICIKTYEGRRVSGHYL